MNHSFHATGITNYLKNGGNLPYSVDPHYPSTTLKAMPFSDEDMIAASELREFVYCEKAWFLARHGFAISPEGRAKRKAGIAFHEERAQSAIKGNNPRTAVWILVLVAAAMIFLGIYTLRIGGR